MTPDPTRALHVLLRLTAQVTDDRPLEDFLTAITDAALELLNADHASIRLLDASRSALLAGARSGRGADTHPPEFRRGTGVIGWVAEHGEPARIDDVAHDERWVPSERPPFAIRSILATPLFAGGEVIGVLAASSAEPAMFGDDELLLLRLLANCSAPPIERARLRRLTLFDDLTMALAPRYVVPRLAEEMERARRASGDVSLLYLDLDHFKAVNDSYGHAAGDAVLRIFAERVRASVRRIDVLCRRGGEEFVLILPGTDAPEAQIAASRILQALREWPFDLGGGVSLRQTASIGVATWDGRELPEQFEARADGAMYDAKGLGRDRIAVAPAAADPITRRRR